MMIQNYNAFFLPEIRVFISYTTFAVPLYEKYQECHYLQIYQMLRWNNVEYVTCLCHQWFMRL